MKTGQICADCAERLGGTSDAVCTHWYGVCDFCGERKGLCSTRDYKWPDGDQAEFD